MSSCGTDAGATEGDPEYVEAGMVIPAKVLIVLGAAALKFSHDVAKLLTDALADAISNIPEKIYQTYTKTDRYGTVYSGRTSGRGAPRENVRNRDRYHHMNSQGYGPAVVDQASSNRNAIRGREQQLIDANGGAQSTGGTSGNARNGIWEHNPLRDRYLDAATAEFGSL